MHHDNYIPPKFGEKAFNCPFCGAYAHQEWKVLFYSEKEIHLPQTELLHRCQQIKEAMSSLCFQCNRRAYWVNKKLVHPMVSDAPLPHKDMPDPVRDLYNEARNVSSISPRSAAALLRVAIEDICAELGENGPNLYTAIKQLHEKGMLPIKVIESLDIVRIYGNESVHPGTIDLTGADGRQVVNKLFWLVNFIVEKAIAEPREIEKFKSQLPKSKYGILGKLE